MSDSKRCSKCGQVLPVTEFYIRKASRDGRGSYCRPCGRSYAEERRRANGMQPRPVRQVLESGQTKECRRCHRVLNVVEFSTRQRRIATAGGATARRVTVRRCVAGQPTLATRNNRRGRISISPKANHMVLTFHGGKIANAFQILKPLAPYDGFWAAPERWAQVPATPSCEGRYRVALDRRERYRSGTFVERSTDNQKEAACRRD